MNIPSDQTVLRAVEGQSSMISVFIDGSSGTTGLRIRERLAERPDIRLIQLDEAHRKNPAARQDALNSADAAFLCLPDDAAREAVGLLNGSGTVVIDTSTAHRTHPDWAYGFPELKGQRELIRSAQRIANPGCHASGFIALAAPLVAEGALPRDARLSCFSLTGYSGGGKKMIAEYEAPDRDPLLASPRQYGLGQAHKHLPEMQLICGLDSAPLFSPIVAPYYAGMEVTVPLFADQLRISPSALPDLYRSYYTEGLVRYTGNSEGGFCAAGKLAGRDDMEITVAGNGERVLLIARFDNLGKGASGAAIQNMNIRFGLPEAAGLCGEDL